MQAPGKGGPQNARHEAVRAGEHEVRLVRAGKAGGDRDRLPARQDRQPEYEVEQQRRDNENTDVHAPLDAPDREGSFDMTSKHGGSLSRERAQRLR